MNEEKDDNAGVRVPPPLIYLSALIAGLILNYFFPIVFLPVFVSRIVGILSAALAVFIMVSAFQKFKRAETNLEPWKPTTAMSATAFSVSAATRFIWLSRFFIWARRFCSIHC
jgi:hypothetical protein